MRTWVACFALLWTLTAARPAAADAIVGGADLGDLSDSTAAPTDLGPFSASFAIAGSIVANAAGGAPNDVLDAFTFDLAPGASLVAWSLVADGILTNADGLYSFAGPGGSIAFDEYSDPPAGTVLAAETFAGPLGGPFTFWIDLFENVADNGIDYRVTFSIEGGASIPEPSSLALLSGALGLSIAARRRRTGTASG